MAKAKKAKEPPPPAPSAGAAEAEEPAAPAPEAEARAEPSAQEPAAPTPESEAAAEPSAQEPSALPAPAPAEAAPPGAAEAPAQEPSAPPAPASAEAAPPGAAEAPAQEHTASAPPAPAPAPALSSMEGRPPGSSAEEPPAPAPGAEPPIPSQIPPDAGVEEPPAPNAPEVPNILARPPGTGIEKSLDRLLSINFPAEEQRSASAEGPLAPTPAPVSTEEGPPNAGAEARPSSEEARPPGGGAEAGQPKLIAAEPSAPPVVWLLAMGLRGDVAPFVPLSIALRDAGFRVLVCTAGSCTRLFTPFGVPTLGWDQPVWKWSEGTVNFFRMRASDDSPDIDRRTNDIDDIFLHTTLQKVEYCHWRAMWAFITGNQEELVKIGQLESSIDEMATNPEWDRVPGWTVHRVCYEEYMHGEAEKLNCDVDVLKAQREHARRKLLEYLKVRALSVSVLPLHLLTTLHHYLRGYMLQLMEDCKSRPGSPVEPIIREFEDIFAWCTHKSPEQWLEGWLSKFPPHCNLNEVDILANMNQYSVHLHAKNLLMLIQATQSQEDLPQLLLANTGARALASVVSERVNCRVLPTLTDMSALQANFIFLIYSHLLSREKAFELDTSPFRDLGVANFVEELRDPKLNMLCTSPTMQQDFLLPKELKDDEEWVKRWKSHALGPFLLDTERQLQSDSRFLFGDEGTRQQLKDFLAIGKTPVCVHWGTATHNTGVGLLAATVGGLRLSGQRGVIISRWTRLSPSVAQRLEPVDRKYFKEEVLLLKAAPHGWLFPKCSCVVNYGGRGTFCAALCAGLPFVLVSTSHDGVRAPLLRAIRGHESVHSHNQLLPELTPKNLAQSLSHVLSSKELQAAAHAIREQALTWPGAAGALEIVRRCLEESMEDVAQRQAKALRGPWMEGQYDAYDGRGEHLGKVDVQNGRMEWQNGDPAWIRAGTFKKIPAGDPNQPWQPLSSAETTFHVEVFQHENPRYAVISEDGQTWKFEDGGRLIYRPSVPKACQCTVS